MRTTTLLLCLALAGCAGANAAHEFSGPAVTAPPAAAPPATARSGHNAQAAAKKEEWWKEGGVTREKINAMCWMKYEQGRRDMPVEKRADLVNQCVEDAEKQYPVR
jgi:hypothetical protein